jgi:hypothetical protein
VEAVTEHVCTVSSVYSCGEIRRALAFVQRHWRRIRGAAGGDADFCLRARTRIAAGLIDSEPDRLCHWPCHACGDYTPLLNALQDACPGAIKTIEVLDDVIEAMASGYWNGCGACEDEDCTERAA